jgi:myo-inositol-1(or 4)-monophosphatase
MTHEHHLESHAKQTADDPASRWAAAPPFLRELLALADDLARAAGRAHVDGRRHTLRTETKSSPTDIVSQIDKESERLIVDRLRELRPDDALLAEEGTLSQGTSGVRWVIDPLDGTTNYVYGYPAFAASIGVEVEGQPVIGVVYESSAGRMYKAISGFGAACDDKPLRARRQGDLSQALVATGFSYEAKQRERQGEAAARVLGRIRDIRRGGSAALDLCHVAAGHLDAYWELDLSPWDYAAGGVIAREAGAEVVLAGAAHGRGPAVIAAHPALMPAFLDLLRETGALVWPGARLAHPGRE